MGNPFKSRAAMVIAGAAVIGLVGAGGAVAGNMVGTDDLQNRAVAPKKIQKDAIGGYQLGQQVVHKNHVANGAIGSREIGKNSVGWFNEINDFTRNKIENVAKKHAGKDGVSGYQVNIHYTRGDGSGLGEAIPAGEVKQLTDKCPEGLMATGGGFNNGHTAPGSDLTVRESHPSELTEISPDVWGAPSWSVTFENETDEAQHASVYTICADVTPN